MRIDILSLVISFFALVRPYLESIYTKKFKPGKITFYPTGRLEIGFSDFGATLGIYGTLRISDSDVFVTHVECKVTNLKDKSEHHFEWLAVRPFAINLTSAPATLELPAGFNLVKSQPHKLALTLCDRLGQSELRPIMDGIRGRYQEHLESIFDEAFEAVPSEQRTDTEELSKVIYEWFIPTDEAQKSTALIQRKQIWRPGDYKLEMLVYRATGGRPDVTEKFFRVTAVDEDLLLANSDALLRTACGQFDNTFNFAHCEYESTLK